MLATLLLAVLNSGGSIVVTETGMTIEAVMTTWEQLFYSLGISAPAWVAASLVILSALRTWRYKRMFGDAVQSTRMYPCGDVQRYTLTGAPKPKPKCQHEYKYYPLLAESAGGRKGGSRCGFDHFVNMEKRLCRDCTVQWRLVGESSKCYEWEEVLLEKGDPPSGAPLSPSEREDRRVALRRARRATRLLWKEARSLAKASGTDVEPAGVGVDKAHEMSERAVENVKSLALYPGLYPWTGQSYEDYVEAAPDWYGWLQSHSQAVPGSTMERAAWKSLASCIKPARMVSEGYNSRDGEFV